MKVLKDVKILKEDYDKSIDDYNLKFKLLDSWLYNLCSNCSHSSKDIVYAKIWAISRVYSTGIERSIGKNKALEKLAEYFYTNSNVIESIIASLPIKKQNNNDLNSHDLKNIIIAHGNLVKFIENFITSLGNDYKSTRSFASKYLHFHYPNVPIYDNITSKNIKVLKKWNKNDFEREFFVNPSNGDFEYYKYTLCFLKLYNDVKSLSDDIKINVKFLDYYLISYG